MEGTHMRMRTRPLPNQVREACHHMRSVVGDDMRYCAPLLNNY